MNAKKMVFVGRWLAVVALAYGGHASGQSSGMVPGCLGCFPRTGPVYDSTHVTPAPPFTTSASTGNVYIPPREVIVTIPGPPSPPASDPTNPSTFQLAGFNCGPASGTGAQAMDNYVAYIYTMGGRCADPERAYWTGGLRQWISANMGTPFAEAISFYGVSEFVGPNTTGTQANILGNVGSGSDRAAMTRLCQETAANLGYISPSAYSFVFSTSSATCSK